MPSDSTNLSSELRLLLAAIEHRTGMAISLPVSQELDWERTCAGAVHHGLGPLLHRLIEEQPKLRIPESARFRLKARAQAGLRQHLLLAAELNSLLAGFAQAGIETIPYKGPALAAELYDLPELRPCGDLDLLILPEQLQQAEVLLRQQSYRADVEFAPAQRPLVLKNEEEVVYSRPPGIHVELHWRLAPRQFAVNFDLRAAWQRSSCHEFFGVQMRVLSPEDLLLALVIHGGKHAWERLIWVCDMALLLRRYPAIDWERIIFEARKLGTARALGVALGIVQALLPTALPPEIEILSEQAATQKIVGAYLDWLCRSIAPGGASEMSAPCRHLFILQGREQLRDRWLYLWRLATLPTAHELALIRLPRPLHPLYAGVRAGNLLLRLLRERANAGAANSTRVSSRLLVH